MAHSQVCLNGRRMTMHDIEILVTAHWLLRHAEAHPDRFPEAEHGYLAEWRGLLDPYIPGALDLGLDGRISTAAERDRFAALVSSAREALLAQPEEVPGATLNALLDAPDLFTFESRPRGKMLADLDKLVAFVDTAV